MNPSTSWNANYAALLAYREQHGHCNVPYGETYECILPGMGDGGSDLHYKGKLGAWLASQRQARRGAHTVKRLTVERESKLQELVDQGTLHFTSLSLVMSLLYICQ